MDSGVVNNNASPAHSEIVAFLQSGQLLNLPSFSNAGLVNDFAQEILKQTVRLCKPRQFRRTSQID
jgi:hypothetical protein